MLFISNLILIHKEKNAEINVPKDQYRDSFLCHELMSFIISCSLRRCGAIFNDFMRAIESPNKDLAVKFESLSLMNKPEFLGINWGLYLLHMTVKQGLVCLNCV